MRAPVDTIVAPPFPTNLPWVNASRPQPIIQRGKPMLVEFWDFCRPNSLRTLPYVKAWHERYARAGLRVFGVHCPGFDASREEQQVRDAVARLEIAYPVLIDSKLDVWMDYGNEGWPARYLFDGRARLVELHYGEGAYTDTELAIQELLGVQREPLAPLRPEDAAGADLVMHTHDHDGAYCGRYEAGGVWAVLDGAGVVEVNGGSPEDGTELTVTHPGAYALLEHDRHTIGVLELKIGTGVTCLATCFTPGIS